MLIILLVLFFRSIVIDSYCHHSFRNFQIIQSNLFHNLTFQQNQSITIQLINVSIIDSGTFSKAFNLPQNSNLSIEIGSSSIILKSNAFNHIKIDHLRFSNINNFNGRPVFDTNCFGNNLEINKLIFEQCGLTGFSNSIPQAANVNHLTIINSPALTQLTNKNLPSFLSTIKSLEISNTGLQIINTGTFQAWSLVLEELSITNNSNLEIFPSHITEGVLMKLNKLDLSYNSIKFLDRDYDWHAYSYAKELLLKDQSLDLFLKTNILSQLPLLEIIDFSQGFITEDENENLIRNYFPTLINLNSIDISYTNLTENMIIDLLTKISQTTNRFVDIHLHGHLLSDHRFCSYFIVFKNAPNLLNLQLDESHECNCVIDLFFREKLPSNGLQPLCLLNSSRTQCDILAKLSVSKCPQNSRRSNTDDHTGNYAFGGLVAGLTILVLVLLSLGVTTVYRIRRRRRSTDLTMEEPIENPLDAIIEERLQNS